MTTPCKLTINWSRRCHNFLFHEFIHQAEQLKGKVTRTASLRFSKYWIEFEFPTLDIAQSFVSWIGFDPEGDHAKHENDEHLTIDLESPELRTSIKRTVSGDAVVFSLVS